MTCRFLLKETLQLLFLQACFLQPLSLSRNHFASQYKLPASHWGMGSSGGGGSYCPLELSVSQRLQPDHRCSLLWDWIWNAWRELLGNWVLTHKQQSKDTNSRNLQTTSTPNTEWLVGLFQHHLTFQPHPTHIPSSLGIWLQISNAGTPSSSKSLSSAPGLRSTSRARSAPAWRRLGHRQTWCSWRQVMRRQARHWWSRVTRRLGLVF